MILLIKGRPLGSERVKKKLSLNLFTPKSDFIDFTLSKARGFYSSKGDPLGVKGLMGNSLITQNFTFVFLCSSKGHQSSPYDAPSHINLICSFLIKECVLVAEV